VAAAVTLLPLAGAVAAAAATAVGVAGTLALSYRAGWLLDVFTIGAAAVLALIGAAVRRYQTEGKQRRFIAGAFSRYVAPKVVKQLLEDPSRLVLGGERRELTLFFSDLQGFTSISEGMGPTELVAFLNEYTTLMADVVTGLDGTIDKYIGDSVMAFWGAPVPQPDHARRALLAALSCQERLIPFCDGLAARGGPRLVTRIGVNSGECVVGNMGSARPLRLHTAIGDTVNQASPRGDQQGLRHADHRLREHLGGGAGGWRSGGCWTASASRQGRAGCDPRGPGRGGAETEAMRALAAGYAEAYSSYQARQWPRTIALAEAILRTVDDGPSKVLIERSRVFSADAPPTDWDGVWTLMSK
jgi:adenylate cyclase